MDASEILSYFVLSHVGRSFTMGRPHPLPNTPPYQSLDFKQLSGKFIISKVNYELEQLHKARSVKAKKQ
jgi:hypothetical protein